MPKVDPVDELLEAIPSQRRPGKFDRWLEEDPDRAAEFWRFVQRGQNERNGSIETILKVWNSLRPPCPVSACRIRERLREERG